MSKERMYTFYGGPWNGEWKKLDGSYIIRVPVPARHNHPDSCLTVATPCYEPSFVVGEYVRSGTFGDYYEWKAPKEQRDFRHHHGEIKVTVECGHGRATTCGHVKTTVTLDCAQ